MVPVEGVGVVLPAEGVSGCEYGCMWVVLNVTINDKNTQNYEEKQK